MRYVRALLHAAPHVAASACVVLVAAGAALTLHLSVRSVAREYVHALAPVDIRLKPYGLAINEEAFRHDDLLVVFGSSELLFTSRFDAYQIFRYYQTGFQVYSVATPSATPIILLQRIGALGTSLRGRKVVITVTPPVFFRPPLDQASYVANYSVLHAAVLTFSTDIPVRASSGCRSAPVAVSRHSRQRRPAALGSRGTGVSLLDWQGRLHAALSCRQAVRRRAAAAGRVDHAHRHAQAGHAVAGHADPAAPHRLGPPDSRRDEGVS